MLQFPDEPERSILIQQLLQKHFDFASRMYSHWLRGEKDVWLERSELPEHVLHLAMALNVQMIRQYRSVIEDCKRCEALCANILCRSLFETVLAIVFLLKPKVYIFLDPDIGKDGLHKKAASGDFKYKAVSVSSRRPKNKSGLLSRELRGYLYLAHDVRSEERFTKTLLTMPGLKRVGRKRQKTTDTRLSGAVRKCIGPKWDYVVTDSNSYSGLNIEQLAKTLDKGLHHWYRSVYGTQSKMTHGADAIQHFDVSESGDLIGGRLMSTNEAVASVLAASSGIFLAGLFVLQENIGFGNASAMVLRGLKRQLAELR